MKVLLIGFALSIASIGCAVAQIVIYRNTLSEQSVETRAPSIQLDPVDDDVRFAVTLRNKETGVTKRHEFDGEGASDPRPYQMHESYYCDTSIILLTVEYPWRHDLPQYRRVLDTFAFRESDFAFIDVAYGPLTDIALQDSTYPEELRLDMLAPVGVRCLSEPGGKPFEFVEPPA